MSMSVKCRGALIKKIPRSRIVVAMWRHAQDHAEFGASIFIYRFLVATSYY